MGKKIKTQNSRREGKKRVAENERRKNNRAKNIPNST
jgi:hypothetical protein